MTTDDRHAALDTEGPIAPPATRREWIGLAVLALPCMLYSMDLTVLNLAVPHLSADLKPTSTQLLWIVDIYGFLIAGLLITMGTLGDRIGRRKLLLIGALAFGLASVLAAFSVSADMLIAARALLGVAGATLAPSTLSLIRNMFLRPQQRTVAISVWVTSYSVGGAIGPLIGGVLLEHYWWGSVFLVGVPVMLLLLAIGPFLLPEYKDPNAGRLDLVSAGLSLLAVLAVIFGFKLIAQNGVGWLPLLSIAIGVALGAVFVRRQRRLADPLIDMRLFRTPAFSASLLTNVLCLLVAFGSFLFVAQYLQLVMGLSPLQAGLWTAPAMMAFVLGSLVAPLLVRWARPPVIMVIGTGIAGAGFVLLTQVGGPGALAMLVAGSIVFTGGLAPVVTLTTDLIVGSAPPERAGAASAISETGAEFGGALGIALLGSIGTAVYRSVMADGMPDGLPAETVETARDTIGGAVATAALLPEPLGGQLLASARGAFDQAFELIAVICAVVLFATAAMVAFMTRRIRVDAGPAPKPELLVEPGVMAGEKPAPAVTGVAVPRGSAAVDDYRSDT